MNKKRDYAKPEYSESFLNLILEHYVNTAYKTHDWEVVAIDVKKNTVVFRRYPKDEGS